MNRSILMLILTAAFVAGCGPVSPPSDHGTDGDPQHFQVPTLPSGKPDVAALKRDLLGLSPKEVKGRLGVPDQTLRNPEINGADGYSWAYVSKQDESGKFYGFIVDFNANVVSDVK